MPTNLELSDAYDYQPGGPVSVNYLLAVTPDHIQKLLEQRTGRAFIQLARQWSEERRAPMDDATPMLSWTKDELDSVSAYLEASDATLWTHEDHYLAVQFVVQRYMPVGDTRTEGEWRAQFAKICAKIDANIEGAKIPGWAEEQKKIPVAHDPGFAEWLNKKLYPKNAFDMVYIENEGALYRGPSRGIPLEEWNGSKFAPCRPPSQSRPITWGCVITDDEAKKIMDESKQNPKIPEGEN